MGVVELVPEPVASVPASEVATVYTEPAKDVTSPAPLVASVIAWPPADVTIVATCPPTAESDRDNQRQRTG